MKNGQVSARNFRVGAGICPGKSGIAASAQRRCAGEAVRSLVLSWQVV